MTAHNKKILVTKLFSKGDEFDKTLRQGGFEPIYFPVTEITGIDDFTLLDEKLSVINKYDGIFFTSGHAVKYFFERLTKLNKKYSGIIYAVGEKTKAKIESFGYICNQLPEEYSAGGLLKSISLNELEGKKFLFPHGNLTTGVLQEGLKKVSTLDEVIVYNNSLPLDLNSEKIEKLNLLLEEKEIICIVFFSPSAIENFMKIFPDFKQNEIKIAVIGSTTANKVIQLGLKTDIIPDKFTSEGLASSIVNYFKHEVKYAC